MPLSNPDLWARMRAYDFPLANRKEFDGLLLPKLCPALQTQSVLNASQCAMVIEEYRRFIYLVAVGKGVLAPSPLIDFVWHIHLRFQSAYADDFCAGVVGKYIRHIEGRPQAHEDPAYQHTLAAYLQEFGTSPDPRLWPSAVALKRGARFPYLVATGLIATFAGCFMLPLAFAASFAVLLGCLFFYEIFRMP